MKRKTLIMPVVSIALTAVVLLGARTAFSGMAQKNAQAELARTVAFMLPESQSFTEEVYEGDDASISRVFRGETGSVIETVTSGYAGDIVMLVGVSKDGKVTGVTVRDLSETWGLGARALTETPFLIQLLGTQGDAEVGTNADALTGATVTSKAIARGINAAVGYVTGVDTSSGATSWGG